MPEPARRAGCKSSAFLGIVLVEGFVTTDGDYNQMTRKTMATWKCQPAEGNGKPVPALVPFEVNFRLY